MSHYIIISADSHKSRTHLPSALDLLNYRLKRKQWGFRDRTRNRKYIKVGDKFIFYVSGNRSQAQHFVAESIAASESIENPYGPI